MAQTQTADFATWGRPSPGGRRTGVTVAILVHAVVLLMFVRITTSSSEPTTAEMERGAVTMMSQPSIKLISQPPTPHAEPPKPLFSALNPSHLRAPPPAPMEPTPITFEVPEPAAVAAVASNSAPALVSASALEMVRFPMAYLIRLSRMITTQINYPSAGRKDHHQGTAIVRIQFGRDGTVLDATVVASTGHESLDREARNVVLRLGRLPPVPRNVLPTQTQFVIDQPVAFQLT